ncbi:MAG: HIT family protein [Gammaproteobacteria bacterium]|nr:HIT family protein [Gammaproteobacteria bacterium]
MNDRSYPWLILVPERVGITEMYQLTPDDRRQLMEESAFVAQALARAFSADKMNVANLGNAVPQLHIHHIVRHHTDPAWPAPVWGRHAPRPYAEAELMRTVALIEAAFDQLIQG